jgi:hypothetical protein
MTPLSCPFCGCSSVDVGSNFIECSLCNAEIVDDMLTREQLIKRWNRRNGYEALVEQRAAAMEALRDLFDCEALEMYRRDDNPEWDAPEVAKARAVLETDGST